jgi:hypothetical protein
MEGRTCLPDTLASIDHRQHQLQWDTELSGGDAAVCLASVLVRIHLQILQIKAIISSLVSCLPVIKGANNLLSAAEL